MSAPRKKKLFPRILIFVPVLLFASFVLWQYVHGSLPKDTEAITIIISVVVFVLSVLVFVVTGIIDENTEETVLDLLKRSDRFTSEEISEITERSSPGLIVIHNESDSIYYAGTTTNAGRDLASYFNGDYDSDVHLDYKNGDTLTAYVISLESSGYESLEDLKEEAIAELDAVELTAPAKEESTAVPGSDIFRRAINEEEIEDSRKRIKTQKRITYAAIVIGSIVVSVMVFEMLPLELKTVMLDDILVVVYALMLLFFVIIVLKFVSIHFENKEMKESIRCLVKGSNEITPEYLLSVRNQFVTLGWRNSDGFDPDRDLPGVYILHNVTKDMYYVGQGKRVLQRASNHFYGRGNGDVYADYKYGDKFKIRIILLKDSGYTSLNSLEKDAIAAFDAYDRGYNKTRGNNT